MRTNAFLSLVLLTVAGGAIAGCGEEPIPDNVSYARDIKPLMEARCIRCHGAGDAFNRDPGLSPAFLNVPHPDTPTKGDFTRLDDHVNKAGVMVKGLMFYTRMTGHIYMDAYLIPEKGSPMMPPPPAPALTTRERDMLLKWVSFPNP
jgi:hypothetical protein